MPAFAIAIAATTMAAQNVGAHKWDRVTDRHKEAGDDRRNGAAF